MMEGFETSENRVGLLLKSIEYKAYAVSTCSVSLSHRKMCMDVDFVRESVIRKKGSQGPSDTLICTTHYLLRILLEICDYLF